jgi:hypothetical protein
MLNPRQLLAFAPWQDSPLWAISDARFEHMSALPSKADMCGAARDVCYGPEETSQSKEAATVGSLRLFPHIPFICVETDEKALIFRLAIIFEVTAA